MFCSPKSIHQIHITGDISFSYQCLVTDNRGVYRVTAYAPGAYYPFRYTPDEILNSMFKHRWKNVSFEANSIIPQRQKFKEGEQKDLSAPNENISAPPYPLKIIYLICLWWTKKVCTPMTEKSERISPCF